MGIWGEAPPAAAGGVQPPASDSGSSLRGQPSASMGSGRQGMDRRRLTSLMKCRHRSGLRWTSALKLGATCAAARLLVSKV